MLSNETLSDLKKQNAVNRIKSPVEQVTEDVSLKVDQLLLQNKYIEDSIKRIREQVNKGKQYKFAINRDNDGLIKDVVAIPIGEFK